MLVTENDMAIMAIFEVANCDFRRKSWSHKMWLQVDPRRSRSKNLTLELRNLAKTDDFEKIGNLRCKNCTSSCRVFRQVQIDGELSRNTWKFKATGSANPILSFVQVPLAQLRKCLFCKRDLQKYGFRGEWGMCKFCTYHSLWCNCGQKFWPQNSKIRRK